MSNLREAALQRLTNMQQEMERSITALRAALAQPEPAAPTEPAPGWCKHCQQYTIAEPLPAAPTVVEPVAFLKTMYSGTRPMLEVDHLRKNTSTPVYTHPPRTALSEQDANDLALEVVKGGKSVQWLIRKVEAAHGIKEQT